MEAGACTSGSSGLMLGMRCRDMIQRERFDERQKREMGRKKEKSETNSSAMFHPFIAFA